MNWRKSQLCCSTHWRWVYPVKLSVLTYTSLGTRQEQSTTHGKQHKPLFGTVLCTWGSTAGPCPANLCKELTWGTLMGTAVIVPKACWKRNNWTQLKTRAQLPQAESVWPSGSPSSSLSLPNSWQTGIIYQPIWSSLSCLESETLLLNLLYNELSTEVCCHLRAFGSSERKGDILLWIFLVHKANRTVLPCLKTV